MSQSGRGGMNKLSSVHMPWPAVRMSRSGGRPLSTLQQPAPWAGGRGPDLTRLRDGTSWGHPVGLAGRVEVWLEPWREGLGSTV